SPLVSNVSRRSERAIALGLDSSNSCNRLADSVDGTPPILFAAKAANCGATLRRLGAPDGVQPRRIRSDGGAKRIHRSIYSVTRDLPRGSDVRSGQRILRDPTGGSRRVVGIAFAVVVRAHTPAALLYPHRNRLCRVRRTPSQRNGKGGRLRKVKDAL